MAATAFSTRMELLNNTANGISKKRLWSGRIISGLVALFCLFDAGMKVVKPTFVVQASAQLGYPESTLVGIGIALLVSTLLYVVPRTSIFGAILLTGYLGGAIASNVRVATPLFNLMFPAIFAILVWFGLWLREDRLHDLLPFTSRN